MACRVPTHPAIRATKQQPKNHPIVRSAIPQRNEYNHRAQQEQSVGDRGDVFSPQSFSASLSPSPSPLFSPFSQSLLPPATAASKITPTAAAGHADGDISPRAKASVPSVASPRIKQDGCPTSRLQAKSATPTSGGKVSRGPTTAPPPSISEARPTFLTPCPGAKATDYHGQQCYQGLGGIGRATTCLDDPSHPPAHAGENINGTAHPSCGPT